MRAALQKVELFQSRSGADAARFFSIYAHLLRSYIYNNQYAHGKEAKWALEFHAFLKNIFPKHLRCFTA